ncbi:hypothetical protein BDV95DRAFT_107950 [Massariosphaeria phaeospora]|uniref:Uncharacterized protein n=1 Tax=Massariosphaeria phaeospora TaxID=100035 RepID=A0A7C8M3C9_9PLEO|nr:hypothetical protein BDV95DRAFT_107950 [Massariosphaeria phaeospora]
MCMCTQYDSASCGHSWISMSHACGFLRDLLNCTNHQIYQTLVAPPFTCPQCNGGWGDGETIQMLPGPWGCNQMLRTQFGCRQIGQSQWHGGQMVPRTRWGNGAMVPEWGNSPLVSPLAGGNQMMIEGCQGGAMYDDCCDRDMGQPWYYGDSRRRNRKRDSQYFSYRRSTRPANNCIVM